MATDSAVVATHTPTTSSLLCAGQRISSSSHTELASSIKEMVEDGKVKEYKQENEKNVQKHCWHELRDKLNKELEV